MTGKQPLSFGDRCYRTYRKIRFLAKSGSLFSYRSGVVNYNNKQKAGDFTIIFLNSTFLYLLANILVSVVTRLSTGISALAFDIRSICYYYDINYLISGDKWTTDAVQAVFSTGPLIALFLGILLFLLYISVVA
ncbi:MAG: hypothetical protein WCI71_10620, partial [Bacteroidota bacterium]